MPRYAHPRPPTSPGPWHRPTPSSRSPQRDSESRRPALAGRSCGDTVLLVDPQPSAESPHELEGGFFISVPRAARERCKLLLHLHRPRRIETEVRTEQDLFGALPVDALVILGDRRGARVILFHDENIRGRQRTGDD